jgi:Bacterial Ig-like domain/Domain of unknown function (DUF4082)
VLTSLVNSVTPSNKATGVAVNSAVQIRFNTAMNAATLNASTLLLRNPANNNVAVSISYDSNSRIATLTPSAPLANGTTYSVVVKGGAAGVLDTVGDAMAADLISTFTTAVSIGQQSTPVGIFSNSAVPTWIDNPDNQAVELGMKFRSNLDGFPTEMRFYTAYIASYHTNAGHYSDDISYFSAGSITTGPLHALGDGIHVPNGVYHYGAASALPSDLPQCLPRRTDPSASLAKSALLTRRSDACLADRADADYRQLGSLLMSVRGSVGVVRRAPRHSLGG